MKNVMFQRSLRGTQMPLRKGRGAVAAALVAASGVAALAFAPSAQAATEYNVILTKIPTKAKSVELWDSTNSGDHKGIGCFKVQSGKATNTGYKIAVKHYLTGYMFDDSKCSPSSYKGFKHSATVTDNLGTTNFWFSLS